MNGVHDMGGMHGFGPVGREAAEPVFHHDWERIALAMSVDGIATGQWSTDEFRQTRERVDPATYLASSYYELWMEALEQLLIEKGIATPEEIERRQAIFRETPDGTPDAGFAGEPAPPLPRGPLWQFRRLLTEPPRFTVGDAVRTDNRQPRGHTRLPRYARRKRGAIAGYHGAFDLADAAAGGEERPEHLYSVRFEASEIWGPDAEPHGAIYLDAWESYLRAV